MHEHISIFFLSPSAKSLFLVHFTRTAAVLALRTSLLDRLVGWEMMRCVWNVVPITATYQRWFSLSLHYFTGVLLASVSGLPMSERDVAVFDHVLNLPFHRNAE